MAQCKECERDTADMRTISGRAVRLNKQGVCPVCVEVNAEIAMENKERLREARKLVASADLR